MRRIPMVMVLMLAIAPAGRAQSWQRGRDIPLIARAVAHRAERDADTLLAGWQAEAHGILRFTSVMHHGDIPVERVVRADELRVEVYGEAPNRSKQIIVGWRDTTFLPNHLDYHRDHLGIVANDFGPTLRLGQGEEVRDVPHPLSAAGLDAYQFRLGDTLLLSGPGGRVRVVSIEVRPAHLDSAGTVGTLYLDLDRAALVRFRFTFTPAAYRDRTVAGITVTLENALERNARWLPWRQSIVIRRAVPWLDFPLETVIRGDWTIDNYRFGVRQPADRFRGAFIDGPREPDATGTWAGSIPLDGLPATNADVVAVREAASHALNGRLLDAMPRLRLLGAGVSDFLRINRVEGVTPAIGARVGLGGGVLAQGRIGYGLSDHRVIGRARIEWPIGSARWGIIAERTMQDVADVAVISGVANSVGTALDGDDYGDYTLVDRAMLTATLHAGNVQFDLRGGEEWSRAVSTTFTPLRGIARANPALGAGAVSMLRAAASRWNARGGGWGLDGEAANDSVSWARVHGVVVGRIAAPSGELQLTAEAGAGTADLPGYRDLVLGGRGTLLGVPFRSLGGRRMGRAELALEIPVALPTPPVPYSRYVRLPSILAPFVGAGIAGGEADGMPWEATGRVETVAGLRLDLWGPLLRIETGISLRTGRVGFAVDAHPDWWGLM